MTPPSFSLLFTLFLPLPEAEKKHIKPPPPPPPATLFIGLLALILVKGTFCNVWLLNLISLFLISHSAIKLMVCVPSASLFACASSSFIESSRSLNPGTCSRCFSGCTFHSPSPTQPLLLRQKRQLFFRETYFLKFIFKSQKTLKKQSD